MGLKPSALQCSRHCYHCCAQVIIQSYREHNCSAIMLLTHQPELRAKINCSLKPLITRHPPKCNNHLTTIFQINPFPTEDLPFTSQIVWRWPEYDCEVLPQLRE